MEMPMCYRFDPTDEEIILHYLYNKTHGFPLSSSSAVIECDLYDETDAWKKFFDATRETALYFFTKLRKKSEKGSRVERVSGSGTWRSQNDKDLYNGGDRRQPIGYKRSFTFIPSKNAEEKGKWVMNEYRLHESLLMNKKSDLVICRIKKKVTKEESRSISKLMKNNNSSNFVGGELIVYGSQEGMNMGASEVEKSDYIDDNNQSLTVKDVEVVMKTKELGFKMEEIEGGSNQNQECYTYDYGGEQKVPDGFEEVGMMRGALEGKETDYIDKSSLGFTMKDLEGTDKADKISEVLDAAYWSWRNQSSHDQDRGMGGLQVEESSYMVENNNQNEHMQECYISEANGGNSVDNKNCLDSDIIVSGISEEMMRALLAEADDYIDNNLEFMMVDQVTGSYDQTLL